MNFRTKSEWKTEQCKNCRYWQGFSEWGDCYRVIGALNTDIFNITGMDGSKFTLPYDPHDHSKYVCDPRWKQLYNGILRKLPPGVVKESHEGVTYLRTARNFWCMYHNRRTTL